MHTGVHAPIFYWWSRQARKFGDSIMNSQGKNTSLKQAGWNPVDVRTQAAGHFAFPGREEHEVGGVVWELRPSALRACAAFPVEWVMESPSLGATVRSPGLSVALKDFLVLHLNVHLKSLPSTVAFRAVPALLFPLLGPLNLLPSPPSNTTPLSLALKQWHLVAVTEQRLPRACGILWLPVPQGLTRWYPWGLVGRLWSAPGLTT